MVDRKTEFSQHDLDELFGSSKWSYLWFLFTHDFIFSLSSLSSSLFFFSSSFDSSLYICACIYVCLCGFCVSIGFNASVSLSPSCSLHRTRCQWLGFRRGRWVAYAAFQSFSNRLQTLFLLLNGQLKPTICAYQWRIITHLHFTWMLKIFEKSNFNVRFLIFFPTLQNSSSWAATNEVWSLFKFIQVYSSLFKFFDDPQTSPNFLVYHFM